MTEREKQKELLKKLYPDYDARRHDAFWYRYQKEQEDKALQKYLKNRGLA
jgi:hypothetical protein